MSTSPMSVLRFAALLVLTAPACSMLTLNSFIASHMVLARHPSAARVWGNATAGANVSVELIGVGQWKTAAAADGSWQLELPPQPAGVNHSLVITDGSTSLTLQDVAFGDVFLCTGQSNSEWFTHNHNRNPDTVCLVVEFSLNAAMNATAEIADSIHYPNLRLATVANQFSATPMSNAPSIANYTDPDGKVEAWRRSGPDAFAPATSTEFSYFSAVCYLFGRDLYRRCTQPPPCPAYLAAPVQVVWRLGPDWARGCRCRWRQNRNSDVTWCTGGC